MALYSRYGVRAFCGRRHLYPNAVQGTRGKLHLCTVHDTIMHIAKIAQLQIESHGKYIPPTPSMQNMTQLNSGPTADPQRGSVLWQTFRLMTYAKCSDPKDCISGMLAIPCLPNLGLELSPRFSQNL